jgi:hypothetical protein
MSPEPEPAAFILDCSPLVLVQLIPVEGNDDDEDPEESEQA